MPALLAVISHCRFNCQPDTSPWRRRPSESSYGNPRDIVLGSLSRYRRLHALQIRRMRAGSITTDLTSKNKRDKPPPLRRRRYLDKQDLTTAPAGCIASHNLNIKQQSSSFSEKQLQHINQTQYLTSKSFLAHLLLNNNIAKSQLAKNHFLKRSHFPHLSNTSKNLKTMPSSKSL